MLGRFAIGIWARMTLRVTLEIVPFGDEANKRTIHTIDISNLGVHGMFKDGTLCAYGTALDGIEKPFPIYHYRENGAIKLAYEVLARLLDKPEANT